jgi:type IV secretion system protein VirD4
MTYPLTPYRRPEPVIGDYAPDALTLGRFVDRNEGIAEKILYSGDQHVLVFGPNGKGKGTRILMPNLLQMSGSSVVVVDPKGELAAVTAPYRRTLGRVVIINPFGVLTDWPGYEDLESCGFNPLLALDPDKASFNVQAALIADAIITVETKDPHWSQSARALIAALVMYVVIEAREQNIIPTMARVRELLCEASAEPSKGNNYEGIGLPKTALEMMKSKFPGLRNKASQFADWSREIQSIASSAKIQTEPFDDPEIANDLSKNGFDFRELKREPITVYLILPSDMMDRHSKWLRLVLTSAIQSVMHPRRRGEPKTLFMLDEFYALGHLEIISTVWALTRGYGIKMMPVLQDLNQLKKLYPDMWETFAGMAGAILSFAPNDLTTAEWLSRRAGEMTRKSISASTSDSFSKSGGTGTSTGGQFGTSSSNNGWSSSTNTSLSTNEVKAALMSAHRLFGLRPGFLTLTVDGYSNMVPTYAPAYYEILRCWQRARSNPYYLGYD